MSKNKEYLIKRGNSEYEVIIGLEVHAQVLSKSKLFSDSPTNFGADWFRLHGYIRFQCLNLAYTEFKPVQKQVMSHLPQNLRLVSSGELTKTKSQNPTQGRRSKAEGNRRRWIRTLMQFLWMIFSLFLGIWLLCFTPKVYMKNIVLDLWNDSSRILFNEEDSNLMEEVKGVLNLTQLVWNGKNYESRNVNNRIYMKRYQSVLSSKKIYSNGS